MKNIGIQWAPRRRAGELGDREAALFAELTGVTSHLSSENLAHEPDEYIRLLKFIDIEAKKERRGRDRDGGEVRNKRCGGSGTCLGRRSPWRAPLFERFLKAGFDTDMSQGLSESEIIRETGPVWV
jgi:hypothetical protein